jgi:hypothetical protein
MLRVLLLRMAVTIAAIPERTTLKSSAGLNAGIILKVYFETYP